MNVILLHPEDISISRDTIIENIKENPVFVVTAGECLCNYIPKLELRERFQSRMLICREMEINVLLKQNGNSQKFTLFSELLKELDTEHECEVVVLGDAGTSEDKATEVRIQLCELIQQFVYINIQLRTVHVCTEKEARDNEKIRAFERNLSRHRDNLLKSMELADALPEDSKNHRNVICSHLENIHSYLSETQNNELKIAVAATKKAGKSVIVNSMIECEIAPTSLELATPNNCIYHKSPDGKFRLKYKDETYSDEDSETIRSHINRLFIDAGNDYKNGRGIPDMEIWYPSEKNSFSSYTIYDTPGPNLAKAEEHMKAAARGVNAADVIIFTINYTNHLTNDEYEYIKRVWKICQEKGKKYSLILNVNQLDRRYEGEGDKSTVRIVDYIRTKLIKTGEQDGIDFRGCVVIGTSALTYFNAVNVPSYKHSQGDCRVLLEKFSEKEIDKCMECYEDNDGELTAEYEDRALSTLNQLYSMIRNANTFHKMEICSLEHMKQFSGMPNLLSYVDYIATQKARNEKINNLMFKIDSEYKAIANLFHIEELMQNLRENQELLEKAVKILHDFNNAVNEILDNKYYDLYSLYEKNIYENMGEDFRSEYLLDIARKYPIFPEEIDQKFTKAIDENLGFNTVFEEVNRRIETSLTKSLKYELGNKTEKRCKIDGVLDLYIELLGSACKKELTSYVNKIKIEKGTELEKEQKAIKNTFEYIWKERLSKLKNVVETYSGELEKTCSEQLNIEIPEFQIVFGKNADSTDFITDGKIIQSRIYDEVKDALQIRNEFDAGKTGGFIGICRKIIGRKKEITLQNIIGMYDEEQLGLNLKMVYEKNGYLEKYLRDNVRGPLKRDMSEFISQMVDDIAIFYENLSSATSQIGSYIDETGKYKKNLEELETEKQILTELKAAVSPFADSWKEVVKHE